MVVENLDQLIKHIKFRNQNTGTYSESISIGSVIKDFTEPSKRHL